MKNYDFKKYLKVISTIDFVYGALMLVGAACCFLGTALAGSVDPSAIPNLTSEGAEAVALLGGVGGVSVAMGAACLGAGGLTIAQGVLNRKACADPSKVAPARMLAVVALALVVAGTLAGVVMSGVHASSVVDIVLAVTTLWTLNGLKAESATPALAA